MANIIKFLLKEDKLDLHLCLRITLHINEVLNEIYGLFILYAKE